MGTESREGDCVDRTGMQCECYRSAKRKGGTSVDCDGFLSQRTATLDKGLRTREWTRSDLYDLITEEKDSRSDDPKVWQMAIVGRGKGIMLNLNQLGQLVRLSWM